MCTNSALCSRSFDARLPRTQWIDFLDSRAVGVLLCAADALHHVPIVCSFGIGIPRCCYCPQPLVHAARSMGISWADIMEDEGLAYVQLDALVLGCSTRFVLCSEEAPVETVKSPSVAPWAKVSSP